MRTIATIAAFATVASGCAIIGARAPGPVRLNAPPDCNSGKGAVLADGIAATFFGGTALALISGEESGLVAALTALTSLTFIGSGVTGNRSADKCRAARDEYDELIEARIGELGAQRTADDAADRADATIDEAAPPVIAPPPPIATTPVMAMRPPAPPAATATDDGAADADDEAADDDLDPHGWTEFWREVKP